MHNPSVERSTRQRTAIRDAIAEAGRPLLPQEVLDAAQSQVPGLGIATVYRNLKALALEGELRSVELPGENPRCELARDVHHHFQRNVCERVFDVHACPADLSKLAAPGFTVEDLMRRDTAHGLAIASLTKSMRQVWLTAMAATSGTRTPIRLVFLRFLMDRPSAA